jgi:formamidopyrimidine-DNA glycosylase
MSYTTENIIDRAESAGMTIGKYIDEQTRISRDEAAFAEYWADSRLCHACGWQGVPETVGNAEESIEFCPNCRGAETFAENEGEE